MKEGGNSHIIPITWDFGSQSLLDLLQLLVAGDFFYISNQNDSMQLSYLRQFHQIAESIERPSSGGFRSKMFLSEVAQWLKSLHLPQLQSLVSQMHVTGNVWIVKPIGLSCGERIRVGRGLQSVLYELLKLQGRCVVQKYIEKPLLVRGSFKFDIRQWVLIKSLSPLVLYGFSEFYLRLSSTPFTLSEESFSNSLVHLTNFAIQQHSLDSNGIAMSDSTSECDLMMTMQELRSELVSRYSLEIYDRLCEDIRQACILGVLSSVAHLQQQKHQPQLWGEQCNDPIGFEWLGLDVMVDEDLRVYLIEVNTSPDISYSTPVTKRLVAAAIPKLISLVTTPPESCHKSSCDGSMSELNINSRCELCGSCSELHWCRWYSDHNSLNTSASDHNLYWKKSVAPPYLEAASILHQCLQDHCYSYNCNSVGNTASASAEDSEDEI